MGLCYRPYRICFVYGILSVNSYCFVQGQEVVRAGILEQILNRVVTKATVPVSHYLGKYHKGV